MGDTNSTQPGDSLTFIPFDPFDPKGSKNRAIYIPTQIPRRRLITEEEKANIRAVKAKGPCWRCKVLKKQVCIVATCSWKITYFAV
jgi:hypothetical protein